MLLERTSDTTKTVSKGKKLVPNVFGCIQTKANKGKAFWTRQYARTYDIPQEAVRKQSGCIPFGRVFCRHLDRALFSFCSGIRTRRSLSLLPERVIPVCEKKHFPGVFVANSADISFSFRRKGMEQLRGDLCLCSTWQLPKTRGSFQTLRLFCFH